MIVIKYGGHALPKDGSVDPSLSVIAAESKRGQKFVLVHGGGPQINKELSLHSIKPEMVNGIRVTTPEVLNIVQKVLSGEVLRNVVNQLISLGVNAVGISSGDGATVRAMKQSGELGLVGDVVKVETRFLETLLAEGYLPVISPIGVSETGIGLNLNADLVAGAIGGALKADRVLFMTDVAGIYRNYPDEASIIKEISLSSLKEISSQFKDGMSPKVQALIHAVENGAQCSLVFDGRSAQNLETAIHQDIGTKVFA